MSEASSSIPESEETLSSISTASYTPPDPMILQYLEELDKNYYALSEEFGRHDFSWSDDILARLAPAHRHSWTHQATKLEQWMEDRIQSDDEFAEVYQEIIIEVEGALRVLIERDLPANLESAIGGLLEDTSFLMSERTLPAHNFALWYVRWLNLLGDE